MPNRRIVERLNRRFAGAILIVTGLVCVLINALLPGPGEATSVVRGSGFLFMAGVLAVLIGMILLITGKPVGPEE